MDLFRSMQAFVAVVNAGSMTAAAEQLGVTPAMVGQHVASLETRLGTRLLVRTTRRQSLTDFGASYLAQCRDILDRVALAEQQAETLQQEPRGTLHITAPVTFGAEVLMASLGPYREEAPEVTLDIMLTDRNVDLIEEGFRRSLSRRSPARRADHRPQALAIPDGIVRLARVSRARWHSAGTGGSRRARGRRLHPRGAQPVAADTRRGNDRSDASPPDHGQ